MAAFLAFVGESYWWTLSNAMPPGYMLMQQRFRLMNLGWPEEPLPKLVEIPASHGEFRMGELDEGWVETIKSKPKFIENFGIPTKITRIETPFAVGKYEVTYEEYDYYVWQQQGVDNPPEYPNSAPGDSGRGKRAVVNVSWDDANRYLQWLSDKTGDNYRLSTEAEWEYAARAGSITPYWWGDEAGQGRANCDGCGSQWDNKYVAPVGSFSPNAWGLHDTAGNVWEWTCSEWKEKFDGSERSCVDPEDTSGSRVLRGGSWYGTTDWLRSSARYRVLHRLPHLHCRFSRVASRQDPLTLFTFFLRTMTYETLSMLPGWTVLIGLPREARSIIFGCKSEHEDCKTLRTQGSA